jgi:hypothetical protein
MQDIRWRRRFENYLKAFQTLVEAAERARGSANCPSWSNKV